MSVFWDFRGILWYEFLPYGTTVTAKLYSQQLQNVAEQLRKKRGKCDKVLFLHDNARQHMAKLTQKELETLNFELLPHPPYSPDLAPTDYYLFRSLANHLREKSFDDFDHLKSTIESFF